MLVIPFFFLKADSLIAKKVLWALLSFEALSGIKSNFHKTEMVPLNLTVEESNVLTFIFGCTLSQLPLKYLGIPLIDKKLTMKEWGVIIDKINKKLQIGLALYYQLVVELLNAILSAVSLYIFSLFKTLVKG